MKYYKGDFCEDLTKCTYYKSGVFPFMLDGGPCWGLTECIKEEGWEYNEHHIDGTYWQYEEWLCEGHKNYPWEYREE